MRGDGLAGNCCDHALAGSSGQEIGTEAAGDERDDHGSAEDEQNSAKNDLFDRARRLQKSNHCFWCSRSLVLQSG